MLLDGARELIGIVQDLIWDIIRRVLPFKLGTVVSYDPTEHTAIIRLSPDGLEIGDVQVVTPWVSTGGAGMQAGLEPGVQVRVVAMDEDWEHLICWPATFNTKNKPPGAPAGEWWVVHRTLQTYVKLVNTGRLLLGGKNAVQIVAPLIELSTDLNDMDSTYALVRWQDLKVISDKLNVVINTLQAHVHEDPLSGTTGTSVTCAELTDVDMPNCSAVGRVQ